MKDIILDRIKKGGFNLPKVLERIDQMYIEEKITLEEKQSLENEARVNAEPEGSFASPQAQIDALGKLVKEFKVTMKDLEDEIVEIKKELSKLKTKIENIQIQKPEETPEETPEEPETPVEPEVPMEPEVVVYPEYVQPLGSHDAYNTGDKISYNGKNYECVIDNCVWNPTTYPAAWQEIIVEEVIPEPEVPVEPEVPEENEENIEE